MFKKIKRKIQKNKPKLLSVVMISLILTFLIFPETTFALSGNDILNTTFSKITSVFKVALDVLSLLLWPAILMIGGLIQNDIIFGGGMEDKLRSVWVEVRNIVNIFFVIGLLGVAFYNVLGVGEDKIKQFLPKIIIAIIAVNFTFLASKVVLDVANVVTVSLFAIPQSIDEDLSNVMPTKKEIRKTVEEGICKSLYDPNDGASEIYIQNLVMQRAKNDAIKSTKSTSSKKTTSKKKTTGTSKKMEELYKKYNKPNEAGSVYDQEAKSLICKGKKLDFSKVAISKKDDNSTDEQKAAKINKTRDFFYKLFDKFDANNAALAMALNLQKIYSIDSVKLSGKFDKLALNMIFSVVLYVIYASAYIALFAVLIVRILVLWICIIFSPIVIFSSKVGGPSIPGISDNADKLVDNFIKHVQAPIIIAATMTIGYIMLRAFQGSSGVGSSLFDTKTTSLGLPTSGLDTFKELLIAIATCAIVWMGVFAAAEETIAKGFTDSLKNAVGGLGNFILKSPQFLPLIPIRRKGDKGKSEPVPLASILRGFGDLPTEIENRAGVYAGRKRFVESVLGPLPIRSVTSASSVPEAKRMAARYHHSISRDKQAELYKAFTSNEHMASLLKNLTNSDRKRFLEALRQGNNDIIYGSGEIGQIWQKVVQKHKLDKITPDTVSTGSTTQNSENKVSTGNSIRLTLGAMKSDEYNRIKTGLSNEDQKKLDALNSAKNNDEKYKKAVQDAGGKEGLKELKAKMDAIRASGSPEYSSGLADSSKRESTLKGMYKRLEKANIKKEQIREVLKGDLKKHAKMNSNNIKTLLDNVLNKSSSDTGT